jgi:anti-sigma regulatory factor (Ser/Thr protein kinase)
VQVVETQDIEDIAVEPGEHIIHLYAHESEAEFPVALDSPGRARHVLVATLRRSGHSADTFLEDAALVLSELATNAVVHAGSPFSVAIRAENSVLRIAVQDACPPTAAVGSQGGLTAQTGHGLGLVDTLATRWGVESTPVGKVVWAELAA